MTTLVFSACSVDLERGEVLRGDQRITMTNKELALLRHLAQRPGTFHSRDELLSEIWGYKSNTRTHTLATNIYTLRQKIEADPKSPRYLESVRRRGYRLRLEAPPKPSTDPSTPPPARAHNLPASRDRFVGRTQDLDAITHLLRNGRLVTITGPGGVGKTRAALELGAASVSQWPGGVWFVDLSSANSAADILAAVADALGIELQKKPDAQVAAALAQCGEALLILDNLEQIISASQALVRSWRDAAPKLKILSTSREPLWLRGEATYPLEPLERQEAAALFAARAQGVRPGFSLETSAASVGRLVEALDGLPLAIELAAARLRALTLERLLTRLPERFRLLRSRSPDLPERQRTLWAALAWSWELLSPVERSVLAQASIFAGSFAPDAAEAVLIAEGDELAEDVLADLVDKSLLISREHDATGAPTLRMLESVRAFAATYLDAAALEALQTRHAAFYARFSDTASWAERLAARDNLRAAAQRDTVPAPLRARCAIGVAVVAERQGPYAEGIALIRSVPRDGLSDVLRAQLSCLCASLLRRLGVFDEAEASLREADDALRDHAPPTPLHAQLLWHFAKMRRISSNNDAAIELLNESLDLARRHGWTLEVCLALKELGTLALDQGRADESLRLLLESVAQAQTLGDPYLEANQRMSLGSTLWYLGRAEEAQANYTAAHQTAVRIGAHSLAAVSDGNLGLHLARTGKVKQAQAHYRRAMAEMERLGNRNGAGLWAANLGVLCYHQGDIIEALEYYSRTVVIARQQGDLLNEGLSLCNKGVAFDALGQYDAARQHYAEALACVRRAGDPRMEALIHANRALLAVRTGALAQARDTIASAIALVNIRQQPLVFGLISACAAFVYARAGALDDARRAIADALPRLTADPVEHGKALCYAAEIAARSGDKEEAMRHYATARALAADHAPSPLTELGRALAEVTAQLDAMASD